MTAVAAVVALLGAAACGSEDGGDDERQIRAAVERTQRAFAAGDPQRVCSTLTRDGQRLVGQLGHDVGAQPAQRCASDLRMMAKGIARNGGLKQALSREVIGVEVDGDEALVTIALGKGARGAVPLAKEHGEWKVDALYGDLPADRRVDVF